MKFFFKIFKSISDKETQYTYRRNQTHEEFGWNKEFATFRLFTKILGWRVQFITCSKLVYVCIFFTCQLHTYKTNTGTFDLGNFWRSVCTRVIAPFYQIVTRLFFGFARNETDGKAILSISVDCASI